MATHPVHASLKGFHEILARRTPEELHELAHVKRFLECLVGDPLFRQKLEEHIDDPIVVAREYHLDVDPELFRPLFHTAYSHLRFEQASDRWPAARRWDTYMKEMLATRDAIVDAGSTEKSNPRFNKWRLRQIARLKSELGAGAGGVVHPLVGYELSKGCSIGCWFCGISAAKFGGHLAFAENEALWRGILSAMSERFGAAAQTGFCYWATDPVDNPDYVKFMETHYEITGVIPQTTTAAPLRNVAWTRDVLALFRKYKCLVNRFSIVSVGQLRRVHSTFTPEELLGVELVLQNRGALTMKASVGRALGKAQDAAAHPAPAETKEAVGPTASPEASEGTIACVSGFLVQPLEHRVQLISPTRATEKWPDGYRIYGEETFHDAAEFGGAIDKLMDDHMAPLRGSRTLAFRRDLSFERQTNGFRIHNDRMATELRGQDWLGQIGESIHSGTKTLNQLTGETCALGASVFEISQFFNGIYQAGLLDDDPPSPVTSSKREPRIGGHA